MASVVFSSLGQVLGGPFGAMAGAAAGYGVDSLLFGRGDRMAVGQVQQSAYGVAIPRVYGCARVAGLLIWAHVTDHGAKGSGQRAGSASLAVALSSRPIRKVGRIWADGREIRNAAGQFESLTVMRVHNGTGGAPDPIVAAVEGLGRAPGYAGTAYVVFEELSLAAYGNRIPNLSFEVEADEDTASDWLADLSGMPVYRHTASGPLWSVSGFVASGRRLSDDTAMVSALAGTMICESEGRPVFSDAGVRHVIPKGDLCTGQADGRVADGDYQRGMAHSQQPAGVVVGYLDPQRAYQAGMQGAARQRRGREIQMTLPAVMTAVDARVFAEAALERAEQELDTLRINLGWKWLHIATGDRFVVEGAPEEWRVVYRAVQGLQLHLRAVRTTHRLEQRVETETEAGRSMSREAVVISATEVRTFEPPFPLTGRGAEILVLANGDADWRGAALGRTTKWRLGEAGGITGLGKVACRRPAGRLVRSLSRGSGLIWDEAVTIELELSDKDMLLQSRTEMEVLAGANLMRIGPELVQFRSAEGMEGGRFSLGGLLRGRFGTCVDHHDRGAEAELISMDDLVSVPVIVGMEGQALLIVAEGRGDPPGGRIVEHVVQGWGLDQPAPAHFTCHRTEDGSIISGWIPVSGDMLEWGSEEAVWRGGTWHFVADAGFRYAAPVGVGVVAYMMTPGEQVAACGALFPAGRAFVVAHGTTPVSQRTSRMAAILSVG